jgi:sugar/nucleoside kinase (ribokinase family)
MARVLKDLLANNHPLFLMNIARLERATGNAGIDVRLIGDIADSASRTMREVGLDPANTTDHELYRALNAFVRRDEAHARQILAGTSYVLTNLGSGPISFNILDIVENSHHDLTYERRSVAHAQRKLRAELVRRYAEHERTHADTVHTLAREIGMLLDEDEHYPDVKIENSEEEVVDRPYVLAIGDIFSDAFIALNKDEAKVTKDEEGVEWLSVKFGQKMPYDYVDIVQSVGPSPNAAVSMSRLGVRAGLMAYLGDDETGKQSLKYLAEQRVDTSTIVPENDAKSSYWYVLRYGADRTMLVKNEEFKYQWNEPREVPQWIYLSQLSPNSWEVHEKLLAYLEAHSEVKLAFQPGTSHFRWGAEKLRDIYRRSHIVIMNREEAVDVTGASHESLRDLTVALHNLGPHIVVITDGPNGSYASYDFKLVTIPNYPDPAPPVERTGAGDAFASTIVGALARGEAMDTALQWAPINSAYVVQQIGAQKGLLTYDELQSRLAEAPEWYKLKDIEQ